MSYHLQNFGNIFPRNSLHVILLCGGFILSFVLSTFAQTTVSGTVTSVDGEALPGVNILLKGSGSGTISDIDGNYRLEVPNPAEATLVFTFVGFLTEEIAVNNRSSIDINLVPDVQSLQEVVVVGYGTQRKGDVTSSVASVKSEDFIKGTARDAAQLIQGKVAGLSVVTPSGDPTAGTQIRLRGITTLLGNTDPLVLIDGIPGSLNTVAPEDIESIDILKDGSAAAIYGTRGTNGVILITTKSQRGEMKPTLSYDGYVNTQVIARRPDFLDADDYRRLIAEGEDLEDLGTSTDWLEELTRSPVSQTHNLTFQGGTANTNFTASLNYRDWQGIFINSDNQQFVGRASLTHAMFDDKLVVNLNVINRSQKYWTGGDGSSFNPYVYRQILIRNPTDSVRSADGSWTERNIYFYDNPLAYINESYGENTQREMRMNGSVTWTPIPDLSARLMVSSNQENHTRGYAETKQHVSNVKNGRNGYASRGTYARTDNLTEFTTTYSKTLDAHRFSLLGGYSYQEVIDEDYWMQNWDFPTDIYSYNRLESGNALSRGEAPISSSKSSYKLIGFFGRVNYTFDNRYMIMASVRREGSSKFGANHKWGTFPAVSAGWAISEEDFLASASFINNLKLRAGYGVTGLAPNASYLSLTSLNYGDRFLSNGTWIQGLSPVRNPNPDLRWERKEELNLGLDFAFLGDRISGSIDLYQRDTKDMLWDYQVPVPPYLFNSITANVGHIRNEGIEILVNTAPVTTPNFSWTTSINYSSNKNKLVSLSNDQFQTTNDFFDAGYTGEPVQTFTHRVQIGGPIGNFYGYKTIDIDEDGVWIIESADGEAKSINDAVPEDKKVLGNGLPKHILGWNHTLRYKNLDLNVTMRGAFGFQILNFQRMFYENPNILYNKLRSAYEPVYGKAQLTSDQNFVSYYIEDGDYWKVDNVTLGYNFNTSNSEIFSRARVYVSGLNLLTISGYQGIDPEVDLSGLDPGNDERDKYPTTRTFTLGVNLTF
uniref:TonB-dependent receptor n=1 Tax=Roseihalotalea indica TaxID=2867963 RepID=A0AA49GKE8_9BACT|nr:TonB-dependent receptor [Tunicatimonas sp. TK19036]